MPVKAKKINDPMKSKTYEGLDRSSKVLKLCLVRDKHGQWIKYRSPQFISVMGEARAEVYNDWEKYYEMYCEDMDHLRGEHKKLFGKMPVKSLDASELSILVWAKLCALAKDRSDLGGAVNPDTGEREDNRKGPRKSLLSRRYGLGKTRPGDLKDLNLPKQAIVCYQILRDACMQPAADDPDGEWVESDCTEEELKEAVQNAHDNGVLVTNQDPWRIFQYYRPRLVQEHLIIHD